VCTDCGEVLESALIVSDIQFEENAHGGASAIGQFVSADSKGGGFEVGSGFRSGRGIGGFGGIGGVGLVGRESRELTLRNARNKIRALGQQLALRQDRIEMAFNFYKMALSRNLTRGRKSTHVIAACVYITCRTEGTSHMLIDFSDILHIDVYELGRTYLRLSQVRKIPPNYVSPTHFPSCYRNSA
jgi:transcription factor IIIB subunit 2